MLALILMLAALLVPVPYSNQSAGNWRVYRGAWFEIKYPANFGVRPSQPSSSAQGFDSVFFTAPDGSVQFYVFSPQWNGIPNDIQLNPQTEVVVSRDVVKRASRQVRRVTIKARDGSYLRSYEDTEDTATNTRKVFGISYINQAAYNRYRTAYLTFKGSLTQFAD